MHVRTTKIKDKFCKKSEIFKKNQKNIAEPIEVFLGL